MHSPIARVAAQIGTKRHRNYRSGTKSPGKTPGWRKSLRGLPGDASASNKGWLDCYYQHKRTLNAMQAPPESRQELFERHARECLDLVTHSNDPAIRATFTAIATTWLMLAGKVTSTLPPI